MLMQTTVIPDFRFRVLETKSVPIDKELALTFMQMPSLTERMLNQKRLREIKEKLESGLLIPFDWFTVRVRQLENKQYRMNGQHTSFFLSNLPEPFPKGLLANLVHFEVDSQEDAVLLFRQIDSMMSARKPEDVAYVYQKQHQELININSDDERRVCIGIVFYRWKMQTPKPISKEPKGDDRWEIVNESAELRSFIAWVCKLMEGDKSYLGGKNGKPTIAAMFNTFQKNEAVAREFWGLVSRQGDPYNPEHPTTVLYLALKKILKDKEYKKAQGVSEKSIHYGCNYCWNAYREGKGIKEMRWDMTRDAIE
jgi:hypothetical protein